MTADDSVDFVFTADDPSDTFLCALDGDARDVCEAEPTIGPLSEGQHTLTVWAVDDVDGTVGDSAEFTFTVDLTDPDAPEIDGPPAMTNDGAASLTFTGEDGGSYECQLDAEDVVEDCTSPFVPSDPLTEGYHEFSVWQTDDAGHVGAAATYSWTVDQTAPDAPALDGDVAAVTGSSRATFTFSGEPGGHFECSLNGAPFAMCTSRRRTPASARASTSLRSCRSTTPATSATRRCWTGRSTRRSTRRRRPMCSRVRSRRRSPRRSLP